MEKNPEVVGRLARERWEENYRFLRSIKRLTAARRAEIDALAVRLGRAIEAEMDCTQCGKCCQVYSISVDESDVERLAGRMRLPVVEFRERYVRTDAWGQQALRDQPCPFLKDCRCSVYEDRPGVCRDYPHLGGNLATEMWNLLDRAEDCPIVYEMLEQLKKHFRRNPSA